MDKKNQEARARAMEALSHINDPKFYDGWSRGEKILVGGVEAIIDDIFFHTSSPNVIEIGFCGRKGGSRGWGQVNWDIFEGWVRDGFVTRI